MRDPVLTEHGEGPWRQRHVTIFGPLTTVNVDHHPGTIDVADLEVETFLEPQAQ